MKNGLAIRRSSLLAAAVVALTAMSAAPFARGADGCRPTLPGANVAGGEFNGGKPSAVYAKDYIYPAAGEIALMQKLGLRLMRVPFLWERLQPAAQGPLDEAELGRLDAVVALATAASITVALDAHNYGSYHGESLARDDASKAALPDLWKRLAQHFGGNPEVVFDLMNEPHDVDADAWARIAKDTLAAIRSTGARNTVLIPGTNWDGAHSWMAAVGKVSNADALLPLARDDDRVVLEVHQYFDDNFSGTATTCGAAARVPAALASVAAWARAHRVRVMLGEFGVSRRPECVKALDAALSVIERDRDVWYGWTYWAAGAWWGDYPFNIQASNGDTPQGAVLQSRAAALRRDGCTGGAS